MRIIPRKYFVHVITSLNSGGAESVLCSLVTSNQMYDHAVICLCSPSFFSDNLKARSILTIHLCLDQPSLLTLINLWKSLRLMLSSRLVLSYLYHADLFASFVKVFPSSPPLIWNIHNALSPHDSISPHTSKIINILARLSSFIPNGIIYVSDFARLNHELVGYRNKNTYTIPNPIDTRRFSGSHLKNQQLPWPDLDIDLGGYETVKFGVISRYHRVKRHREILEAFKHAVKLQKNIHLVLAGRDCDNHNIELNDAIDDLGLRDCTTLLGNIEAPELIYPRLDFTILFSSSESFGNVVAESLSSGVPAIVSNLPVFREIFGDMLIYADDVEMLTSQILYAYSIRKFNFAAYRDFSARGASHVKDKLDIENCLKEYRSIWGLF